MQLVLLLLEWAKPNSSGMQLIVRNGLDGRRFRALMNELDLWPIRNALEKFGGVRAKLALSDEAETFQVSTEALSFFRENVADLPRTLEQEIIVGRLFDQLHGVLGPVMSPSCPDAGWEPTVGSALRPIPGTISTEKVQPLIADFEAKLEALADGTPKAVFVRLIEKLLGDVSDLAEYPEEAPPADVARPSDPPEPCSRCGMVGHVAQKDSTEPDQAAGRNCRVAMGIAKGPEAGELSPPREERTE